MNYLKSVLVVLLLIPCLTGLSLADGREHHRGDRASWHGEIGRFHEHDIGRWSSGRWHHGRHEGRMGGGGSSVAPGTSIQYASNLTQILTNRR